MKTMENVGLDSTEHKAKTIKNPEKNIDRIKTSDTKSSKLEISQG